MRRCARWMPLFALVACLPLLAADDEPKPPDADKKTEVKRDDVPDKKKDDKPAAPAKPDPKAAEKKYVEITPPVVGRVSKIDSKSSELHVEVGYGRFAKTEEWTLADEAKYLTRIPPETIDDKGKAKKIVGAELQKLRDPKHTGCFISNVNEVQKGQTVEVVLGRLKESGPKKPAAKGKKADEKEGLLVVRVTILRDDRGAPGKGDGRMPPKK